MHVMGRSNEFEEKAELISEITRAFHAKVLAPFIREALEAFRLDGVRSRSPWSRRA